MVNDPIIAYGCEFHNSNPFSSANKKTTRKGGFLIGKVGFEQFNVTVRWTVTREGLTERNYDFRKAEMKRIPAAPSAGNRPEAASIVLTLHKIRSSPSGVDLILLVW